MNLLPETYARTLERQEFARFIGVASFLFLLAALAGAIALLPSMFILMRAEPSTPVPTVTESPDATAIAHTQSVILALAPVVLATSSPSSLVRDALALKPKDVSIKHISYSSGKTQTLILAGTSGRDGIHAYQTELKATKEFTGVQLPVDVLIGAQGGDFTMTLTHL